MLTTFEQKCYSTYSNGEVGESGVLRGKKKKRSGKGEHEREGGRESCFSNVKRPTAYSMNCRSNKQDLSHLSTFVLEKGL